MSLMLGRRNRSRVASVRLVGLGFVLLSAVVATGFTAVRASATLHVSTIGVDVGNCQVTACASVGYALTQGSAGATVMVGPGTFSEATLVLTYPVSIQGAGAAATTINVNKLNPNCATYIVEAINITGSNNPCSSSTPAPGSYAVSGITLEGNPGGLASNAVQPFDIATSALPANTHITLDADHFVTNTAIDPNLSGDRSIGVYTLGGQASDSFTVTNSTFSGFFQAFFMESFPGSVTVSGNTFSSLTPVSVAGGGPAAPQGVFLWGDGGVSKPSVGGAVIRGNTFSGYSGQGVRIQAGVNDSGQAPGWAQTGTIGPVRIAGNRFDLQTTQGNYAGSAAVNIVGADPGPSPVAPNVIRDVTVTANSITQVVGAGPGPAARDLSVQGNFVGETFSRLSAPCNNLLGGASTAGISVGVPASVAAPLNFWGNALGPGSPGATTVVTANGGSAVTSPVSVASVFAPSDVTTTTNPDGSVTVQWAAPCSASDVPVLSYTVIPFDVTTGTAGAPITVSGGVTSITFVGAADHSYRFDVTARSGLFGISTPAVGTSVPGPIAPVTGGPAEPGIPAPSTGAAGGGDGGALVGGFALLFLGLGCVRPRRWLGLGRRR